MNPTTPGHRGRFANIARLLIAVSVLLVQGCSDRRPRGADGETTGTDPQLIRIDPTDRYQTMRGWEVMGWGLNESPAFDAFVDELVDRIVNEVGINRIRLEVRAGAESDADHWRRHQAGEIPYEALRRERYATVNDNDDPSLADSSGFHFSELDDTVDRFVLPLSRALQENGEQLYVTLVYVAFTRQRTGEGSYHHDDPDEYAEFILAAFQHLEDTFGLVPDGLEVLLEPENVPEWDEELMGQAIIAVTDRLGEHGFHPQILVPSTTKMANAKSFIDAWAEQEGILDRVHTLAYHRYRGFSDKDLEELAETAEAHGLETAMLEWWDEDNGYAILHDDLKRGFNSAWQHGALAGPSPTDLYEIDDGDPRRPVISLRERGRLTRQYFLFIRSGATRIGASTTDAELDPLAFINEDGGHVVVVKADRPGEFEVEGLPAGTYGIVYATSEEWDVDQGDQTIESGQRLRARIPGEGVITIFTRQSTD